MRISFSESPIFVAWLAFWLFLANVPTEAVSPVYTHLLRLVAWSMVWVPLVIVRGISLRRQTLFLALAICLYVLVLNVRRFNFDAALLVANIANALAVVSAYGNSRFTPQFLKALDIVLFSWAGMLLIQLAAYLPTGQILDFHSRIFPFSEARYFTAIGDVYRFTGPHIEPGTYAAWTYGMALLRMLIGRRVLTASTVLALATVPLTLSVWGVMAGAFFALAAAIAASSQRQRLWAVGALLCLGGLALYFFGDRLGDIQEYLMGRAALDDVSGRSKEWAYTDFLANFWHYVLWGKNFTSSYCSGCLSPQDAGLGLNLIVYLGLPFSLMTFLLIQRSAYRRIGWALVLFSLPLFFAKYYIWETIFWFILFLSLKPGPSLGAPAAASLQSVPQPRQV